MTDFMNFKSSQELRVMEIEDITSIFLEINKMVQKKIYKKIMETKLGEIKESVLAFNSNFHKRTKVGFTSCWDQQGNLLPWNTYETLLVESKSKINTSHEKITILKGSTIVNHLQRDILLLSLVNNLFT